MTLGFGVFALLTMPAFAGTYSFEVQPENTKIEWTLGAFLHTVQGTFALKRGRIDFDSESGSARGQVVVDLTGGSSGNEGRDRKMHASVLESGKYPEAVFEPRHFEGRMAVPGTSKIKVQGTFTIHGAAHEITMDVETTATHLPGGATADGMHGTMRFEIPYVAWGMKDPSNVLLKVDKTVQVSIEFAGEFAGTLRQRQGSTGSAVPGSY